MQERQRCSIEVFPILGQSSTAAKPRKSPFYHPAPWQHLEAFGRIGALDDFGFDAGQGLLLDVAKLRSLITSIGEELLEKREFSKQGSEDESAAVSVLNVGGMHDGVQQQAYRIDENMPLLAFDLLARIVAMRVDASPPFSALFTLWLSMMAVVGEASRSACSRHST